MNNKKAFSPFSGKKALLFLCSVRSGKHKKTAAGDSFYGVFNGMGFRHNDLVMNNNICGIKHKYRHHIFKAFDRAHSRSPYLSA